MIRRATHNSVTFHRQNSQNFLIIFFFLLLYVSKFNVKFYTFSSQVLSDRCFCLGGRSKLTGRDLAVIQKPCWMRIFSVKIIKCLIFWEVLPFLLDFFSCQNKLFFYKLPILGQLLKVSAQGQSNACDNRKWMSGKWTRVCFLTAYRLPSDIVNCLNRFGTDA